MRSGKGHVRQANPLVELAPHDIALALLFGLVVLLFFTRSLSILRKLMHAQKNKRKRGSRFNSLACNHYIKRDRDLFFSARLELILCVFFFWFFSGHAQKF